LFDTGIRPECKVYEDWPSLPVERNGIRVVSFPDHPGFRNPCHLFDGLVPGNHSAFGIDGKRCIREELGDLPEAFLALDAFALGPV